MDKLRLKIRRGLRLKRMGPGSLTHNLNLDLFFRGES